MNTKLASKSAPISSISPALTLTPIAYAVAIALLSLSGGNTIAQVAPVLPSGATIIQGAKAPVINQRTMTIDQVAPRAIINWNSFNIGEGDKVKFNQQGQADWSVLNRVVGTERSVINGVLQADGQVFLLNNNGILIGKGAQVNVHTFLASTLGISDKVFNDGILSVGRNAPSLIAGTGAASPQGNISIEPGAIVVAKDGGRISFIASGQIYDANGQPLLDATGKVVPGSVENGGQLLASNGQVILAAGDKVYFRTPTLKGGDENREKGFSGLVVEVDSGGRVANALQGFIQSKLGNISMVGLLVNQDGRVSATTSVNRNGSIWLMARDTTTAEDQSKERTPTRGGRLSLGANSLTDIFPDQENVAQTTVDASPFARSQIRLEGQTIHLQGEADRGAKVIAPSADVFIRARTNPDPGSSTVVTDQAAVVLDKNSRVEVSGLRGNMDNDGNLTSTGVLVPIERNLLRIELRGEQLADAPLLRDSPIRSKPIFVDARVGTSLINQETLQNAKDSQIQRGIFERLGEGGNVNISSTGSVVLLPGSTVALQGGNIAYTTGSVRTSVLFDGTTNYSVATAPNDRRYISISEPLKIPEPGYTFGLSAGRLDIKTRNLLLDGRLLGGALLGTFQQAKAPFRGSFTLSSINSSEITDLGLQHKLLLTDRSLNTLGEFVPYDVTSWSGLFAAQFNNGLLAGAQSISPLMLSASELATISLQTNGGIELAAGSRVTFKPGTDLKLTSKESTVISRSVRSAAGEISIVSDKGVTVSEGVMLDVSGLWLNESQGASPTSRAQANEPIPDKPTTYRSLIDGGKVSFSAQPGVSNVSFGNRTTVDTSSGLYINSDGKTTGGKGGEFSTFSDKDSQSATYLPTLLLGYGFSAGSTFSLNTPALWFGPNAPNPNQVINVEQLIGTGFSTFKLNAVKNVTFATGYQLKPTLAQYELPSNSLMKEGDKLRSAVNIIKPDAARAAPISLAVTGENVKVQQGAGVSLPVGGKISMTGTLSVSVEGKLSAPSGEISLITKNSGKTLGYRPDAGIKIADGAVLDVAGIAVPSLIPGTTNRGSVRSAGTVNLNAGPDSGTVLFDENATIAINGTSATFDMPYRQGLATVYKPTLLASDAGSLNVTSVQGGLFAGKVRAQGGADGKANGKFTFNYERPEGTNASGDFQTANPLLFPLSERQYVLTSDSLAKPLGYAFLADWDVLVNGARPVSDLNSAASVGAFAKRVSQFRISATSLKDGGSMNFEGGEVTRFEGITDFSAKESIRVASNTFRTDAGQKIVVSAPYIRLGSNTDVAKVGEPFQLNPVQVNSGQVTFNASKGIDLEANFAVQGASRVALNSLGSIRLVGGVLVGGYAQGSLNVPGDLSMVASTIFPISRTSYRLSAPDGDVSFARPQDASPLSSSDVPYSALGQLSVSARNIDQAGAIYAPFGQISFNAQQTMRFAPDSVTSVSGSGVQVPLGVISNGVDWVVGTTALQNPNKSINVEAATVVVAGATAGNSATSGKPARIDSSGGGDILAYEFVRGPLGSKDLYSAEGSFAILPSYSAAFAPFLVGDATGSAIARGATIRIENGVAGLPAGVYKILPTAYAQLEGAFLVRPNSASDLGAAIRSGEVSVSRSGVSSVIGYRAREGLGITSQTPEWFEVLSATQVRTFAEYRNNAASSFFAGEAASRVQDAGTVKFVAQKALELSGSVNLMTDASAPVTSVTAASQARRGTLEITSNNNIRITSAASPLAPASGQNGTLTISQAKLDEIAAGDLHIGGSISNLGTNAGTNAGTNGSTGEVSGKLVTQANSVTLDAGVTLKAGTVILSANNGISLGAGSKIDASGTSARKLNNEPRVLEVSRDSLQSDSSGSTVVASSQATVLARTGTVGTSGPQLQVGSQAVVSGSSVVVDTTGALSIDTSAQVLGNLDTKIGTQTIILGQAPTGVPGFILTGNLLNALNQSASISLQGYQKIVTYGNQTLGSTATKQLRLDTPSLSAGAAGSSLVLTAGRIDWLRSSAAATTGTPVAAPIAGTQLTMNINGNTATDGLRFGVGDKSIDGFADTAINVGSSTEASRLKFEGKGSLTVAGNLTAKVDQLQTTITGGNTPVLTNATVKVLGDAIFSRNTGQALTSGSEGAGGKLSISASNLSFDSVVKIPSGEISLTATNGNLSLGSKSELNAAGFQRQIFDQRIELAGGTVKLTAEKSGATLAIADGATIDVSAGNNTAGLVEIKTAGALSVGQTSVIKGASSLAHRGGALLVDAQQGVDLDRIAKASLDGQFNRSIDVRARTGDLSLASASNIKTETVVIAADNGKLDIAGNIDASSVEGGKVELWQSGTANQVLTLRDSARINVAGQTGGEVTIGSTNGIVVAGKPQIKGGSTDARRAGVLTVRAPRTGPGASGTGIAFTAATAGDAIQVGGKVETSIEGVRSNLTFVNTVGNANGAAVIGADVAAYQANAQSIISGAPINSASPVQVLAGIDIKAGAGLNTTNAADLDFANRSDGLGSLTIRSEGSLKIAGSISDGVLGATTLDRNSWSIRLTAGADTSAANPSAVLKNNNLETTPAASRVGVLTIAGNKDVRTGTGSIALSASDQIIFEPGPTTATASTQPGSVYTVGRIAGVNDGYLVAPGYFSGLNVARAQGGSVTVQGGGVVKGNDMQTSPSSWFLRQGAINAATGIYSVVPGYLPTIDGLGSATGFNMHLGSLAGGRLTVNAQGTENLYLANVSSGRMRSTTPDTAKFEVTNQAPTTVTVSQNIAGGQFMTMDGELRISAGQNILASTTNRTVPILFHGNAAITVNARDSISVGRPYNPTLIINVGTAPIFSQFTAGATSTFSTFGSKSSLNVFGVNEVAVQAPSGTTTNRVITPPGSAPLPAFAKITTPNWNIQSATNIRVGLSSNDLLAPTDDRQFKLLASENIWTVGNSNAGIYSSDVNPNLFSFLRPYAASSLPNVLTSFRRLPDPGVVPRSPIRVYAGSGDVAPSPSVFAANPSANPTIAFSFGQSVAIKAGRDVSQLSLVAQNGLDSDETSVRAGRDIVNRVQIDSNGTKLVTNDARIEVAGPGSAVLIAGRDIRFGNLSGTLSENQSDNQKRAPAFSSVGNAKVADLPNGGASLVLIAGVQGEPAYDAILNTYLKPDATGTSFDQSRYLGLARESLSKAGQSSGVDAAPNVLWRAVQTLSKPQRDQLARNIFFQEISAAGSSDIKSGARDYGRGYRASALLFPQDGIGNIDLAYNSVRSDQGGSVQFLAPGTVCRDQNPAICATSASAYKADPLIGNIRVGLPNPPASLAKETTLGVIGLGGANVQAYAGNNIEVNQSRIVAGGGGDLLLWSSGGNIDAGRGSKAAISVPPPVIKTDSNGNVTIDLSTTIQGSGIRAISFDVKRPAGAVGLYAPKGTVDAGDAGIVGGKVDVGARVILNAENIRLASNQDSSTGALSAPAALAPTVGTSSTADAANKAIASSTTDNTKRVRIIVIDFEGFGVDCKENPQDPFCKKPLASVGTINQ